MIVDETEFDVEGDVLRQVPGCVVWLRPKDRSDLVDAFEHPDEHLLVELG
ncbi:hypothetical protein J2X34_000970 [Rhodococcus sp. BE178]